MIAGMDRYFQICRCFRDEDLRADRQPEFTQIDVEISFATEEVVYGIVEGAIVAMFGAAGYTVATPFPRISYDDALRRFGSDKPDLRPGMEIADLLSVFAAALPDFVAALPDAERAIRGFVVSGAATYSRKQLDDLVATGATLGGRIAWARIGETGLTSSGLKVFGAERLRATC
jgi:aspartyl-tRNA synthetase